MIHIAVALIFSLSGSVFAEAIGIHGPERIGVVTNRPFLFLVPATGGKNLRYEATGLPKGLTIDEKTGIVKGQTSEEGEKNVTIRVIDDKATAEKTLKLVVGKNAIALTPIMGWNPWYVWGCNIDDSKVRQAADILVSSGMAAHGYNYINLDDCWQDKRDANGNMVPNKNFPNMKALADYVHSKGLRIGMYTGPGKTTCGGYQATQDLDFDKGVSYLEKDVLQYSQWGFDFIKYDWCIFPRDPKVKAYYYSKQQTLYQRMSDMLAKAPRAMVHMICQYGEWDVWTWGRKVGGNMWRTNHDLADEWPAVLRNGFENIKLSQYAGPGGWNDLDMLMIGKGNWPMKLGQYDIPGTAPRNTQLTKDEQLTHMSLWAIMASPMLFSGDLTQLDQWTTSLLNNDEMIAVNQDALGAPVKKVRDTKDAIILTRPMADGSTAVAFFNLTDKSVDMKVDRKELGLGDADVTSKDIWTANEGDLPGMVTLPAHGTYFARITKK
jgi:alpha-galactosidase